ncbi:hypothetical protein APHCRT_0839 [Anaplasma phagocytophilum str. CRT53-1]|uniref:Uncharacterized protein n=2 Tax=Anaplasma phagocytophilum TaxID=948 RepID=A0A0F3PVX3_ANAPH|nr:hypothetical protein APHWI1_0214 [Anaplasma phagocytophilum str. ApWI1]KJV85897.1 hypothetical protein APHCRT_0839 [Anaplasma phagocytophilum str. CRT53-1]
MHRNREFSTLSFTLYVNYISNIETEIRRNTAHLCTFFQKHKTNVAHNLQQQ